MILGEVIADVEISLQLLLWLLLVSYSSGSGWEKRMVFYLVTSSASVLGMDIDELESFVRHFCVAGAVVRT